MSNPSDHLSKAQYPKLSLNIFKMSEKLCLQWNDFKENAIGSLANLKDDKDFLDVTLASEDGKQIEAHKVILAMSSPFFENILKRNKHPHPLIYMRGVKSHDLLAIVDFLYCGEANINQDYLESFLAIAEELQLKGLMGNVTNDEAIQTKRELPFQENKIPKNKPSISKSSPVSQNDFNDDLTNKRQDNRTVALTNIFSGNIQELDEKCNSMMEKTLTKDNHGHPIYRCVPCGKEAISLNMKGHIELNHLEGVSIPCNFCEKTFRSRNAMGRHYRKSHRNI